MPYLSHDDALLYFTVDGSHGPPVLLLTGFAVGGGVWEHQVAELSPDHQVICLDNRGAGLTRAPTRPWTMATLARDGLAVLDHLGHASAHIVGCSMGGMIAQELALAAPERVRSLTLIATHAGRLRDRLPRPDTVVGFVQTNVGPRQSRRRAVEQLLFPQSYLAVAPREQLDRAVERDFLDSPPLPDRLGQLAAVMTHDTARRLPRLRGLHTLVITAGADRLLPPSGCDALARLVPGARHLRLEEAGHGVIGQCASTVNAALRQHLASR